MDQIERSLLDQIEHVVFVLEPDAEGVPRYVAFNRYGCEVLGKSEADVIGLTAAELYPGDLGEIALQRHVEAFRTGQRQSYEILLPINGSERHVHRTLVPEIGTDGRVRRVIGSSSDRTGQQLLRHMQVGLDTIQGEAEDFVWLAAHDLRTPIRHVRNIAEMLRDDFKDLGDGKLQLIDMLEDLGIKAMELIGDVLSHAEATSCVAEEVLEFDFGNLARAVLALLDPAGTCICNITEARIRGDMVATQIILRNLVENALKHAVGPRGAAGRLCLDLVVEPCGHDSFAVHVADNGCGFDDPALVFLGGGDPRSDSGYGLMGIRRLIHARGGRLSAANRDDGPGARISFTLPGQVRVDCEISHAVVASAS